MNFSIQTLLLPGASLQEQFDNAARYGFEGVEVAVHPAFALNARALAEVRAASRASGLPVCAICTHSKHDFLVPDRSERQARVAGLIELLQQADELGARGVVAVPVRPPHVWPDLWPWLLRQQMLEELAVRTLRHIAERLPAGRSCVFLEPLNRYEAYFLNRLEQAAAIARAVDHPRVKILADLFHMNLEEASLRQALLDAGDCLGHVHIADNNRCQPGRGCLDFRAPFAALAAMGYGGFLSIECWQARGAVIEGDPEQALPETVRLLRTLRAEAEAGPA